MFVFNDVIDAHTTAPIEEDYINKEEEEEVALYVYDICETQRILLPIHLIHSHFLPAKYL